MVKLVRRKELSMEDRVIPASEREQGPQVAGSAAEARVKRPHGWPELAVGVRNVTGPADSKGIAEFPLRRVSRKRPKRR